MFLLTGLFSLSMASCLYDDDDDSQKKISPAYYTQISGSYMGSVQYYVDDLTTPKKVEGIATVITADSTIKVTGLPAEAFVKNISNDDIRNALLAQPTPELTSREKEILDLLAKGYTATQIAEALSLSPETIRWYRKRLLEKFDVANTPELIFQARELGVI